MTFFEQIWEDICFIVGGLLNGQLLSDLIDWVYERYFDR